MKPRLLDLFCGAGGAARGYADAGFEVVGVDLLPQKRYPYPFIQANALDVLSMLLSEDGLWHGYALDDFAAIHASPPCQGYSRARYIQGNKHPMLLPLVRQQFQQSGLPWVIENVSGAPMGHFLRLCGTHFGLQVYRHRQFETSHLMFSPGTCHHPYALLPGYVSIFGHRIGGHQIGNKGNRYKRYPLSVGQVAMGIDWMNRHELSQAIPPAYTRWIGQQLMAVMESEVA